MPTDKKFPQDFSTATPSRDAKVFCDDGTVTGYVTIAEIIGALELGDVPGAQDRGSFTFNQMTPASTWVVTHNLGRHPSITVVDSSGREVEGDVTYNSQNRITVTFAAPFSGTAYCN